MTETRQMSTMTEAAPCGSNNNASSHISTGRLFDRATRGVVVLLLAFHIAIFSLFSYRLLVYPYDWEPSESDHIYYATRLLRGETLYKDFNTFPLLGIGYPPGYHLLLTVPVKFFGANMFTGRIFALVIAAVLSLLIYKAIRAETDSRLLGAAMALSLFAYGPISLWLATIRMETLYVALAVAGMYLISKHERGRKYLVLAAVCLAYAFFTKQVALFALGAAVLFLLAERKYKQALEVILYFAILIIPLTLALDHFTSGWYSKHLFGFHMHRNFSWLRKSFLLRLVRASPVLLAAACFEIVHELRTRRLSAWTCYLFGSLSVAFLIFFDGAAENYFIPLFSGLLIVAGLGLARVVSSTDTSRLKSWVYLLLIFQLGTFSGAGFYLKGPTLEDRVGLDVVARMVRTSTSPVLVDRMSSLVIGTQHDDYFVEPVLLMYLYLSNNWSPDVIVSAVNERRFSLICMFEKSQFVPPVQEAIRKNYVALSSIPVRTCEPQSNNSLIVYTRRLR